MPSLCQFWRCHFSHARKSWRGLYQHLFQTRLLHQIDGAADRGAGTTQKEVKKEKTPAKTDGLPKQDSGTWDYRSTTDQGIQGKGVAACDAAGDWRKSKTVGLHTDCNLSVWKRQRYRRQCSGGHLRRVEWREGTGRVLLSCLRHCAIWMTTQSASC